VQQVKIIQPTDLPLYLSEYCAAMAVSPTGAPKILEQGNLRKIGNH
jgi:hypothetical protein